MKKGHWLGALLILLIGFAIGVYKPDLLGSTLKEKLQGA